MSKDTKKKTGRQFEDANTAALKYKDLYCNKMVKYFKKAPVEIMYREEYYPNGSIKAKIPIPMATLYPTFQLFAASLGVTTRTLRNWRDIYPRFSDAYERAKDIQFGILTTNALQGLYNPLYAKFEAVNHHALADKQEVTTEIKGIDTKDLALLERVNKRLGKDEKSE